MSTQEITKLLMSLRGGDRQALNELVPIVYRELRVMASRALGSRAPDTTLGTTALVHEAYLKLQSQSTLTLQDRRHFFSVAAIAMRQIVIDHARRRIAAKRGGARRAVDLDEVEIPLDSVAEDLVALDEALSRLQVLDERLGRVVELRYFAGLSVEETAEILDVDPRTVKRDWRKARAILLAALGDAEGT